MFLKSYTYIIIGPASVVRIDVPIIRILIKTFFISTSNRNRYISNCTVIININMYLYNTIYNNTFNDNCKTGRVLSLECYEYYWTTQDLTSVMRA